MLQLSIEHRAQLEQSFVMVEVEQILRKYDRASNLRKGFMLCKQMNKM